MVESYRLTVLKALTAHLQKIKHVNPDPANNIVGVDFNGFDLSAAVFRGRSAYGEEAPDAMLSILENPRPDVGDIAGTDGEARKEQWQLLLQGWCKDDPENPTDPLYLMMQVVEMQLQRIIAERNDGSGRPVDAEAHMLGGLITSFSFGPGVVRPPTEGVSSKSFLYMPLRIGLAKSVG